jgi:hypothetical protein
MTAPEQPTPEALAEAKDMLTASPPSAPQRRWSVSDPVRSLVNDIGGCWSAFEHELREVIGNTNYASVAEKIETLRKRGGNPATRRRGGAGAQVSGAVAQRADRLVW